MSKPVFRIAPIIAVSACLAVSLSAQTISFAPGLFSPGRIGSFNSATGDFNKDGKLDLALIVPSDSSLQILPGKGDGTFQTGPVMPVGRLPFSLSVADFNKDGKPDIVTVNNGGNSFSVLLGRGDSTFQDAITVATARQFPRDVAIADFNADGNPDLAITSGLITNGAAYTEIWLGKGDGTFANAAVYPTGTSPEAIVSADLNADGKPDLLVYDNASASVYILLGKGAGQFTSLAPLAFGLSSGPIVAGVLAVVDLNGDGRPDIVTGNLIGKTLSVALGRGDGGFAAPNTVSFGSGVLRSSSLAVADFDGDGKPDLAIGDNALNMVAVLSGNGDGTFKPYELFAVNGPLTEVHAGDADGDGKIDLLVTRDVVTVLRNTTGVSPAPSPALSLSTSQLSIGYKPGDLPPLPQAVDISNKGTGVMVWSAAATVPWLLLSPTSGTTGLATLAIALNPIAVPASPGTYQGAVLISATGSNTPRTINVTLTVAAAPPALILSVTRLQFNHTVGEVLPVSQPFSLASNVTGAQAWSATASVPWLSVSPASGSTPSTLTVGLDPLAANALAPGVYQGSVTISATGASIPPVTLPVTFTVSQPVTPAPSVFGVRNSASYGSAVAQGSIFVIQGDHLGPATLVQAASYPLALQLAGSSVQVSVGGTTVKCPMFYTSVAAIAAVLPSNTPTGTGQLTVTFNGITGYGVEVQVVRSKVGVYTVRSSGSGPGIITGLDYVTKTTSRPAKPGETLILWATGLGPAAGNDADVPKANQQYEGTEVFVGDRAARLLSATRSGCCAGLDQIAFEVPDGPESCFVPVSIRTPGGSSNFVTLPISADGGHCANPAPGVPVSALTRTASGQPLSFGLFAVGPVPVLQDGGFDFPQGFADRLSQILNVTVPKADVARLVQAYRTNNTKAARRIVTRYAPRLKSTNTSAIGNLVRAAADSAARQGAGVRLAVGEGIGSILPEYAADLPAVGTCMIFSGLSKAAGATVRPLDAGNSLTASGPGGLKPMSHVSNGQYQAVLGPAASASGTLPGLYTFSGTGGKDVGPFSVSLNVGSPFIWTNKSALTVVDRSVPLTVTWSGGAVPGHLLISGATQGGREGGVFVCAEETRKGTFTIPQFVLSALPPSPNVSLLLAAHPLDNPVSVPGLDLAYIANGTGDSRTLRVQ